MVEEQSEMERMGKEAVWDMVQQLQAGLQAREKQLERQGQQLANMQEVQEQLQVCLFCMLFLHFACSMCDRYTLHARCAGAAPGLLILHAVCAHCIQTFVFVCCILAACQFLQ